MFQIIVCILFVIASATASVIAFAQGERGYGWTLTVITALWVINVGWATRNWGQAARTNYPRSGR